MPDLGKYALQASLAYIVSLALLAVILWLSARQSKSAKTALEEMERRKNG